MRNANAPALQSRPLAVAILILTTWAAFSQSTPPNDHFTNSIQLEGTNITINGSFVGATVEPGETPPVDAGMEADLTIWYSWAAPVTGRTAFKTDPLSRRVWVHVGSDRGNLRRVPVLNRNLNNSFLATEGTVYHFQLGGATANGDTAVTFHLELSPEFPCDNDNFSDAALLKGLFFNTWHVGAPIPPLHWTLGATRELGEPAHRLDGPGNSLWWKWVAPLHARLVPETRLSTATNMVMAIYQGTSVHALTFLGRFTNSASPGLPVMAGETYYIAAAVTNAVGDVYLAGHANGNTSHTPVPGNVLLNPSFEQGVLFDHWSVTGGYGGAIGENGGADGRSWPAFGNNTKIWQDIPTVPGHQYRIRFIWRFGGDLSGGGGARSCRVLWDSNEVGIAEIPASDSGAWQCPTFFVTATSSTSRFMLHNPGPAAEFDGCSVVDITAGPAIVTQPVSISTVAGGSAAFVVGVSGTEPLSFQWFFDGVAVPGGTNRALVIDTASNSNAGAYYATVQNSFGAVTSSVASLNVESPTYPIIVWQPYSEKVATGGYACLSVVAAGTAPLTYQWHWNDQPLAGATNGALIFDPVALTNAGTYQVLVSNSAGSVWSLPATLTVTATNEGGARIHFNNRATPFGLLDDVPIFDVDAFTRLNGSNYVAQLYAGATLAELRPAGTPSVFLSGFNAGFFASRTITLANIAPGSNVLLQVRAWERSKGTTYEEARALGGKSGKSGTFNVTTHPLGPPAVGLAGLQSFALRAGLPFFSSGVIHLSHREPQGIVVWSLQGEPNTRYVIEKAVRDFVWEPYLVLTNVTGTVTFTDSANSGANVVLFRARILD